MPIAKKCCCIIYYKRYSDFLPSLNMKKYIVNKLLLTVMLVGVFNACTYLPEPQDVAPAFSITENNQYIQITHGNNIETGIIFYPGGLVDAHAYIPALTAGNTVSVNQKEALQSFIVKMPANLAVLDAQAAVKIVEDNPHITQWYIAGHSLGGAMACTAVNKNQDLFEGLILMAAYPAGKVDLSNWTGKVLSLRGSNDGLTTQQDIDDRKNQLPDSTIYITIEGGNHAGFGAYGEQKNDGINELETPSQIDLTIMAILDFIG